MEQFAPHALTVMILTIIFLFVGFLGLKTIYDYIKSHVTEEVNAAKTELSAKLDAVKADLNVNNNAPTNTSGQ
jgi:hypothetical protein